MKFRKEHVKKIWKRFKKSLKLVVFSLLSLAIGIIISKLELENVESMFLDFNARWFSESPHDSPFVLVYFDQQSLSSLKHLPTFRDYNLFLSSLEKHSPRMVLWTLPLDPKLVSKGEGLELSGKESLQNQEILEYNSLEEKEAFRNKVQNFTQFYVLVDEIEDPNSYSPYKFQPPLDTLHILMAPSTKDKTVLAKDSSTRRVILDYKGISGQFLLAQKLNPSLKTVSDVQNSFELLDSTQAYFRFKKMGSFPKLSWFQLMSSGLEKLEFENVDHSRFSLKDKVVLVGEDLNKSFASYFKTPFSEYPNMSYIELQAHMIQSLIEKDTIWRPSLSWSMVFICLFSLVTFFSSLLYNPIKGIAFIGVLSGLLVMFSMVTYYFMGWWVPIVHTLLALFINYYFFIPYRLIEESKKNWALSEKNQLLSQVEELKTNFISMMSHDLKTPLARIHGMVEIFLADFQTLTFKQREALDIIRNSCDDLNKFINSILNYAKIESQGIQLQKSSRDVNEIIQDAVKKCEFLAKLKNIHIKVELEPLFSIPVDSALISQVLSNLIENAIKYSPNDSKILVSSEEIPLGVQIQVADQGPGIPEEEQSLVFMKFFRSKNVKSSPIKGSGLGLYLAKYFVELHGGQLFLESSSSQGSTFVVELPADGNVISGVPIGEI